MTMSYEQIREQARQLSEDELIKLQEDIEQYLQAKKKADAESQEQKAQVQPLASGTVQLTQEQPSERRVVIPGAYRLTPEQVQARMEKLFGAEQLERIQKIDISKLPQGDKSLSEMINEDREDRF